MTMREKGAENEKSAERFILIISIVVRCARSSSSLEMTCPECVSDLDLVWLAKIAGPLFAQKGGSPNP